MRRMYSVKELSDIIYSVVGGYIEDGDFDQIIEDYIDEYIAEHPIDPTAITGLDIAPKDVTASGNITGASIIENMSGYSLSKLTSEDMTITYNYAGVVKNGNKLTISIAIKATSLTSTPAYIHFCNVVVPNSVLAQLVPTTISGFTSALDVKRVPFVQYIDSPKTISVLLQKEGSGVGFYLYNSGLTINTEYYARIEVTFLLSENLAE